jgi:hypothetical protein
MAYGGGYLIKPVQSKNGSISELYLAGQAQVQGVRDKVREERRLQNEVVGKATDFESVGIQDMDNYWAKAGTDARSELMELQERNRRGEISRSDVVAMSAKITGEMKMIGQLPTIIKEQRDKIIAESEKEGYSGLTLAEYDRTWFKDHMAGPYGSPIFIPAKDKVPAVPDVIATPADINAGKLDVNGKPAVAGSVMVAGSPEKPAMPAMRRQLKTSYAPELIDGKQFMRFSYEQMDQSGNIEYKSIIRPLGEHVNPSKKRYLKVDDKKEVQVFAKNLGDLNFVVTGANGLQQPLYQAMQTTQNGTAIYGRISNPQDVDYIADYVEQEVTSKSDDWIASYAYDILGARTPFGDGASGFPMSPADVEKRFSPDVYYDYDHKTSTSTPMKFTSDPLMFDVDEKGNTVVTDDTKRLVLSHYRNQIIASINVDSDVYKDRKATARAGRSSTSYSTKISPATYTVNGQGVRMDANHLLSTASVSQLYKNKVNSSINPSTGASTFNQLTLDNALASMAAKGSVDYSNTTLPTTLTHLGDSTKYDQTKQGAVNFGGMMKNLEQVLNVTTFNDSEFKNITGYYTAEDNNGQPIIILMGDALYGDVSSQAQAGGNAQNLTKTSGTGQFVARGLTHPLDDNQAQNLYLQMWDPKRGNPQMVDVFQRLGYNRKTKNFKEALHLAQGEINR